MHAFMNTLYRAAAGIAIVATSTLAGAGIASAAVAGPAAACSYTETSTHRPDGSASETRTRQCGDVRWQDTRAHSVYASGTVSDLTRTRTQDREGNRWITVVEHQVRTTGYASGTVSRTVTVIASCTQTVTRHTVYASGRVTDTTRITPVC